MKFVRLLGVPASCFKIIVVLEKGMTLKDATPSTRVIAVIMPNSRDLADQPWTKFVSTIDELEQATGYKFLTNIPADVRKQLAGKRDEAPIL